MGARQVDRLGITDSWEQLIPALEDIVCDEERQFTPGEFKGLLQQAGFVKIEQYGYGLLPELLGSADLLSRLAPHFTDLCRAEADNIRHINIGACDMQFASGRKP